MAETTPLHGLTAAAGATFLEEAGWQVPAQFGDPLAEYERARSACALFDRSHTGKVEVAGADAASFLHNLCTNDIKEMPVGAGCEAFFTTNTAKVVSHFLVYHLLLSGERSAFWLDVPPGTSEQIIQHLDHFLISEQVELADRTREFAQMHLCGPQSREVLERALVDDVPPLGELQHMVRTFGTSSNSHVRRHSPLGAEGYDLVCLRSRAETVWQMLVRAGAAPAGQEAWDILRVEGGTPVMGVDVEATTFAPEVGRTEQAISYNKGCYLGQEPIVMARDRGQVSRRLVGVRIDGDPVPHNARLFAGDKEIGRVTSSVRSPRLGVLGLAYVRRSHQEPGTRLEVEAGTERRPAEVTPLPFVTS